ncbi:hypothetical protein BRD07_04255 [Halobacteriales archaeon QS_9_68_42]|nr:MAG: hypothetical protein BRD07_04255 [Halobacteriales archaeon QS_9_68_42]
MRFRATALALLLVVSAVGAAAAPAATQQAEGEAYSGAFVAFETTDTAVSDYAVDGSVVVENVSMQSASEAEGGLDAGLSSVTGVDAAGLSVDSRTDASATLASESGAKMETHDNQRGVVQIRADGESQVVHASVDGEAESESDKRVVVTSDDGTQGTFVVVGDGDATVNEEGDVVAQVDGDGQLVYRQYNGERDEEDETQERMIQNGTATAEVYVHSAAESGGESESNGTSVVEYGQDTTVEVQERSESRINMTAERTESEGKVIITTVSDETFGSADSTEVFVDGEAAAQADSYGEVQQATQNGDNSRYLVRQSSSAEAATDVVVGINQFSERQVSMQSDGDTGDDGGISDADGPGFGALAAIAALGGALVALRRRT